MIDARYVSFGADARRRIADELVAPLVEASAITVADSVRRVINASSPAGRKYRIPGTKSTRVRDGKRGPARRAGTRYTASAPGQAPAEREAIYRDSWTHTPAVVVGDEVAAFAYSDATVGEDNEPLGPILEDGDRRGRLRPRPHAGPAIRLAEPKIRKLVNEASR